jgi:hypothetical protein
MIKSFFEELAVGGMRVALVLADPDEALARRRFTAPRLSAVIQGDRADENS